MAGLVAAEIRAYWLRGVGSSCHAARLLIFEAAGLVSACASLSVMSWLAIASSRWRAAFWVAWLAFWLAWYAMAATAASPRVKLRSTARAPRRVAAGPAKPGAAVPILLYNYLF